MLDEHMADIDRAIDQIDNMVGQCGNRFDQAALASIKAYVAKVRKSEEREKDE